MYGRRKRCDLTDFMGTCYIPLERASKSLQHIGGVFFDYYLVQRYRVGFFEEIFYQNLLRKVNQNVNSSDAGLRGCHKPYIF